VKVENANQKRINQKRNNTNCHIKFQTVDFFETGLVPFIFSSDFSSFSLLINSPQNLHLIADSNISSQQNGQFLVFFVILSFLKK